MLKLRVYERFVHLKSIKAPTPYKLYGVLYTQNHMSNSLLPIEEFEQFETIRRVENTETGETYFAVVDVIDVLAEPKKAGEYWRCLLYTSPSPRDRG